MTLKRRPLAFVVTAMLVLGTSAIVAGPSPAEAKPKRFTVFLAEEGGGSPCVTQVDTDKDGTFSAGDTILEDRCDVLDSAGNRIGQYSTLVTVLGHKSNGPAGFVDCVVTLDNGSKLAFSGPGDLADVATTGIDLVVTGGTGRYAGAGGAVNIVHVPGTPARAAFELTRR